MVWAKYHGNLAWATGPNFGLLGKLKISSELLPPLDYVNLAWTTGPNLGLMGNLKISSQLLKSLDYWNLTWATGPILGLMRKCVLVVPPKILTLSETIVKRI